MTDFNDNKLNENGNDHKAENNENQVNSTPPNSDPYKTTGGNAGTGWQAQQNPYGTGQYNPRTGWNNGRTDYRANYSANYNNAGGTQGQHKADEEYKWNFAEYDSTTDNKKAGKKKNKGLMVFTTIVCSMFAVAVIGMAGYGVWSVVQGNGSFNSGTSQITPGPEITSPGLNINDVPKTSETIAADGSLTTKQIAAKVQPSVVGVVVYAAVDANNPFYGGSGPIQTSEGSGIIMSADGYIITNAHVVAGASGMKVVLYNDEEYDARLVGRDDNTDLAVIKIEANNLTAAEFGDSAQLQVGEDVVAIGNPGGLEFASSVTKGIISGVNRPIKSNDAGYTMNCIQTDAAINPGNSGGALVNVYGQVIGINSSKIASTEYEGLGFAIPISEAKPIIDDLIANGRVTGRVKLGITGREIDDTLARYNNVPAGFMVYTAEPGSDIANKGVLAGDIITKIDGKDIATLGDLRDYLKDFKPGDKVTLTVFRRTSGKSDSTFEVIIALMADTGDDVNTQQMVPQQKQNGNANNFFSFLQ
ncbi:trypsin-like peptidase domain-containing protein [Hydrogenoanaerobacterium sp.]|uniref:S1C family serine protease n=1 Tax=Hydrogenoanaerobacterium sp. TaxID=2953763 RepID=UPI00289B7D56|nr:trypsin-like peptidase domain-containing protein [Hydrogenoanaerobacterium sp.]